MRTFLMAVRVPCPPFCQCFETALQEFLPAEKTLHFSAGSSGHCARSHQYDAIGLNLMLISYGSPYMFYDSSEETGSSWINLLDNHQIFFGFNGHRKSRDRHSRQNWIGQLCRCFDILGIMVAPADDNQV